ncbi:MAG: class I SAM-dependent methyltransferase [Bacteroidota bacterium]
MSLLKSIRRKLTDPRLEGIDPDSIEFVEIHRQIMSERKYMRDISTEFYSTIKKLDEKYFNGNGMRLEIGAGCSFFSKLYPEIINSDIKPSPFTDKVIDALAMPFDNNSLRAVYGINCFHHFEEPERFFTELIRVLQPGGGCILIDPYYGFVANKFYQSLTDSETFDKKMIGWNSNITGTMQGANQALSYIVFKRDIAIFQKLFPELELLYMHPFNNYIRYLISGGLNFKPLLPYGFRHILRLKECLLSPFKSFFALHHVIVIRKKKTV